ncbi:MAG: ribonuclease J [Bacteroidota bacterium]
MSSNICGFDDAVRVISLGGMGDIGKNMTLFTQRDSMIAVDCGLMFPDEEHPGVDVILPDMSYVLDNADKMAGVVLTHGHEDHIGALPYLLEELPLPVYGTRLTLGLLEAKLQEYHPAVGYELIELEPGQRYKIGDFEVELVRVSHSIPDGMGLAIHSVAGTIFHTGDFKFDQTPIGGNGPDFQRLAELGAEGLLCLISDCTNVERPGYCPSEKIVGETLRNVLRDAPGRVIVTTFASNVGRVQQVIDQSAANGRVVAVTGRSMERIVATAERLGYLHIPPDTMISIKNIDEVEPDEVTIVTTGSQGEPLAALSRMARGSHRHVKITADDTVVMSASPIPGNESLIWRTINRLFGEGARVIYGTDQGVHVSGHAYREELKLMLSLTRPRFVIPTHGDQRHLVLYADLAEEMGIPRDKIFQLYPGASVEFRNNKGYRGPNVPAGSVNVDGLGVGDVGDVVISDRNILASEGIFLPVLVVDRETRELLAPVEIYSRGFVYMDESEELIQNAKDVVHTVAEAFRDAGEGELDELYDKVKSAVGKFLWDLTERRPMVLPVLIPVGEPLEDACEGEMSHLEPHQLPEDQAEDPVTESDDLQT